MMSLGQYLGSGFYDMWFISPAFKGIVFHFKMLTTFQNNFLTLGIGGAFLITYISYGLYSSVPIAWLFVYFRDAFIATSDSAYKWSYCNTRIATNSWVLYSLYFIYFSVIMHSLLSLWFYSNSNNALNWDHNWLKK